MKNDYAAKVLSIWESNNKILQPIKKELHLDVIDQIASLFAIGSYYYYILNFENLELEFVHSGIQDVLGISPDSFSLDTLFEVMHPDDITRMHEKEQAATNFLLKKIAPKDIPFYKVTFLMRLRDQNGNYKTILHQAKALHVSDDGKIHRSIIVHTDVSYLKMPVDHKMSFIGNERPSFYTIETRSNLHLIEYDLKSIFSTREKEVISKIALGETSNEIAESMILSIHTVNTHKKNIMKKSGCKNTSELIAKCLMEGVI
jgi:DNA-binding CsgD family transcriptional regulator